MLQSTAKPLFQYFLRNLVDCADARSYVSRLMTKTTKWLCTQRRQISLGICPVWSESLLCAQWVAKDPSFLHADRLIRLDECPGWSVFVGHTWHFVGFVMRWLMKILAHQVLKHLILSEIRLFQYERCVLFHNFPSCFGLMALQDYFTSVIYHMQTEQRPNPPLSRATK